MSPTSIAEEEIFQAARRIGSAEARSAYLDQVCRDNGSLREQVEALLAAFDSSDNFLESPSAEIAADVPARDQTISEGPGTVIGPYKLVQQIGEGGMGIVFLAHQEHPVKRQVALKVIKPGMDTRQVIARFEAERQALAMMDHPNIAKVLDAGTTGVGQAFQPDESVNGAINQAGKPDLRFGRPYFVMELVQGVPITEYCDQCNLTTGDRLDLFVTVCQAVQHAHQKGIIHRDLKPNNVLVAIQDGRATPKIIDFGVAKAINQQLTEHTLMTAFAQIVGTPLYMSPEQAELSPLGVDTRSDIYSLGVLLYELLTGTTPFDKDRLHAAAYDELRRIIREEEPPRPSARISTLAADVATTVAERRHTDTRRLRQTIHGDLDWIVMKCLEKDRNRRYDSAGSLARDIERYLHDEPVQACPPSLSYRSKKFIRRNKVAAAFICLLIASVAALTASNIQSRRNEQRAITESARAQAVSDLLQELLTSADASRAKGVDYKVRELLDDFSAGLGNQLTNQPEAAADIHATIGRAYRSLKLAEKAQPHFEKAIELHRAEHPQSERLAAVMVDGAWNLLDQQRRAEAESQANQAMAIYRGRGVTGALLFHALEILQHILRGSAGREEDAERVTQEALAVARQSGQEFPDEANLLHRYADLKIAQGKVVEAERVVRQSVDMHRRLHGDGHPETAFGLKTLARALESQHKLADAEAAVSEALKIFRRQFPEDHENVRDTIYQLRTVLQARQDRTALEALDKEEALTAMQSDSPDHYVRLAELLLDRSAAADREAEARQQIVRAIEAYGRAAIDSPDDSDRRLKAVDGYVKVAELCAADPNLSQECEEVQRKLTAELAALLMRFPDSPRVQEEVGYKYRSWAMAINHNRKYLTQCERAHREAIKVLAELSQANPRLQNVWFGLANSYAAVSDLQRRLRMEQDAEATAGAALVIYQQHAAEIAKASTGIANQMVTDYFRLARLVPTNFSQVDSEEAHRFIDHVIDEYRQIIVDYPDNLDRRVGALSGYAQVVGSCAGAKGFEVEVGDLNRRLELELPKLLAAFPDSRDCQWHTAMIYRDWATQIYPFGRYLAQAEQALAQSLDIFKSLARSEPNRPRVRVFVGDGHFWHGDALWRLGRRDDAGTAFQQAIDIFDEQWAAGATDWTPGDFFGISVAYVRLAEFLASTGREDEAAKVVATAALILEREKNPLYVSDGLFGLAMGRLSLGDLTGYRDACHAQYALPVDNANDDIRVRRLWSWCLGPQPGEDLTAQLREAEEFVKHNLLDLPYCDLVMMGAMYLRAGQYVQAAGCLSDSIAAFPSEPPFGAGDVVFPKLFLAMTHWQQGRRDDARQLLAETQPELEKFCNSPNCPWFGRMQLDALRREAEALIKPKEADSVAKP